MSTHRICVDCTGNQKTFTYCLRIIFSRCYAQLLIGFSLSSVHVLCLSYPGLIPCSFTYALIYFIICFTSAFYNRNRQVLLNRHHHQRNNIMVRSTAIIHTTIWCACNNSSALSQIISQLQCFATHYCLFKKWRQQLHNGLSEAWAEGPWACQRIVALHGVQSQWSSPLTSMAAANRKQRQQLHNSLSIAWTERPMSLSEDCSIPKCPGSVEQHTDQHGCGQQSHTASHSPQHTTVCSENKGSSFTTSCL